MEKVMTELTLAEAPLINQLQRVADQEETTADALLVQAVTEFLARRATSMQRENEEDAYDSAAIHAAFEQEGAAFEQQKPQLLQTYPGKIIAIYQGRVVAVGDDRLKVHDEVTEKYGNVPCYIENVAEDVPRLVRITSRWKVQ
jgi:hypothetical protein